MTTPSRPLRTLAAALMFLLMCAWNAVAEEHRLFVVVNRVGPYAPPASKTTELLEVHIVDGHVVSVDRRVAVPGVPADGGAGLSLTPIAVAGGGRYVAWRLFLPGETAVVLDRVTNQVSWIGPFILGLGVTDPSQARLFTQGTVRSAYDIVRADGAGTAPLPGTAGLVPRAISRNGRRLYTVRSATPPALENVSEVVVVNTATNQIERTVPMPRTFLGVSHLAVSEDESTIWIVTTEGMFSVNDVTLRALDATTGIEQRAVAIPARNLWLRPTALVLDSVRQRVVVAVARLVPTVNDTVGGEILSFDARSGQQVDAVDVEGYSVVHIDQSSGRLLSFSYGQTGGLLTCSEAVIRAISSQPGTTPVTTRSGMPMCFAATFASPPPPPTIHTPTVSASHTVTLSWAPAPEQATAFIVEAGSAPGRSDIASFEVTGTSLVVPAVPPGSYYVRVRARDYIGTGTPSAVVRVDVP